MLGLISTAYASTVYNGGINYEIGNYGLNFSPVESVKLEDDSITINNPNAAVNFNKNATVNVNRVDVVNGDLHVIAGTETEKCLGDTLVLKDSTLWLETDQEGYYYGDKTYQTPMEGNARTEVIGNTIFLGDVTADGNININNARKLWAKFPQYNVRPVENATGSVSVQMDSLAMGTGSVLTMVGNTTLSVEDLTLGIDSKITLDYYRLNPYIEHNGLQPQSGYEIIDYTMVDGITRPQVSVSGNMQWSSGSFVATDMLFTQNSVLNYKESHAALDTGYRGWKTTEGVTYYLPRFELTEGMGVTLSDSMVHELFGNVGAEWSDDAKTKLIGGYVVGALTYGNTTLFDEEELIYDKEYQAFINSISFSGLQKGYDYRLELNNGEVFLWAKKTNVVPEASASALLLITLLGSALRRRRNK